MAYEPQQWQDFPSTATPKSAARLTHMETGIKGAHDLADEALSRSGTSGLPTAPTAIPGVLKIETVKKP